MLYPGRAANGRAMGQDRALKLPKRFQASLEPRFRRPGQGPARLRAPRLGHGPGVAPTSARPARSMLEAALLTSCCSG